VLRRLGRFEEASRHFRNLADRPEFQNAKCQQIIAQELNLISRQDTQPQALRETNRAGTDPEVLPDPAAISVKKPAANDAK
jgi:hypothetical protein